MDVANIEAMEGDRVWMGATAAAAFLGADLAVLLRFGKLDDDRNT